MTLQSLLYWLALRHDLLISEDEIWWSSHGPDRRILSALRKHRRGLRQLLKWSSIDVCASRDLHRQFWRYDGLQKYVCSYCQQWEVNHRSIA